MRRFVQRHIEGAQRSPVEMIDGPRADDRARDAILLEEPGQGDGSWINRWARGLERSMGVTVLSLLDRYALYCT